MKNSLKLLFAILVFISFSSCQKEGLFSKRKSGLSGMENVFFRLNPNKNGAIGIKSMKTFDIYSASGQKNLWKVGGRFWGADNVTIQYGNLTLDDVVITPNTYGVYQSESMLNNPQLGPLFGKTVEFTVDKGDIERTVVLQTGLYVPKDIIIYAPLRTTANQVLPLNTQISWNADTNNTKGVYILIEFDPEDQDNSAFANATSHYQHNLIHTDDDGSFTLSANDFSDMPSGAKIILWVGRCNNVMVDGQEGIVQYALYSYSIALDHFIVGQ